MSDRITVTEAHPDHYLELLASDATTAVWRDGFTQLTVVVTTLGLGLSGEVGAGILVSVIDRVGDQTFAWAFHSDSSASYIAEKMPAKAFGKTSRARLAQSIQLMLRLHASATAPEISDPA